MNKYLKNGIIFILIWSAFPADWSCIAVLAILSMYRNRGNLKEQMKQIFVGFSVWNHIIFLC